MDDATARPPPCNRGDVRPIPIDGEAVTTQYAQAAHAGTPRHTQNAPTREQNSQVKTSSDARPGGSTRSSSQQLSSLISVWCADQGPFHNDNMSNIPFKMDSPTSSQDETAAGLHISTDFGRTRDTLSPSDCADSPAADVDIISTLHPSASSLSIGRHASSIRSRLAASSSAASLSPTSSIASPLLNAITEITPLPSPMTISASSSAVWRPVTPRPGSRDSTTSHISSRAFSGLSMSPKKRKGYQNFMSTAKEVDANGNTCSQSVPAQTVHGRCRSISDYIPEPPKVVKPRAVVTRGPDTHTSPSVITPRITTSNLLREEYLAVQRGLAAPTTPPTPPRSSRSGLDESEEEELLIPGAVRGRKHEIYRAVTIKSKRQKKWKAIRQLGQGTFSKVILAVKMLEKNEDGFPWDGNDYDLPLSKRMLTRSGLVAVKVVQLSPTGGADEERMETSIKREVEILKSVNHPSLVRLKAFGMEDNRALLVLNYCPGGDLFEIASLMHNLLTPTFIRRIFAELVSAVGYLHTQRIVHRDIKLENVLLCLPTVVLPTITDWQRYPHPVISLTDFGLSRRIPSAPDSPLLETRCGSEDYAAPEILMGQPYDGRVTDAWALGVLLYALMEGRLPFDPLPGASESQRLRSKTAHRVARIEWSWVKFADEDGEWDAAKGEELEGGRKCVEALLKRARSRKPLTEIADYAWVKECIQVEQGLKLPDDEEVVN